MNKELKSAIKTGLIIGIIIVILGGSYIACHNSNLSWQNTRDTFKATVEKDLKIYDDSISSLYIDSGYVGVYVDPGKWEASDEATRKTFMKEIGVLVNNAAETSGILEYIDVQLAFHKGETRIEMYTIPKK